MSVVPRRRVALRRMRLAAGALLALSWLAFASALPAHAQATDQPTTDESTTTPAPTIFPTPTASSQTCMFGCSSQVQACQNTCISTASGTTVMPSISTVGTTSNPQTCQTNCSTQLQTCQRNCTQGP